MEKMSEHRRFYKTFRLFETEIAAHEKPPRDGIRGVPFLRLRMPQSFHAESDRVRC